MAGWGFNVHSAREPHPSLSAFSCTLVACVTRKVVENTTTETPLADLIVPANTLGSCGALRLVATMDYLNDTTAINCYSLRWYLGATAAGLFNSGSITQSCVRNPALFEGHVHADNATNVQIASATYRFATGSQDIGGGAGANNLTTRFSAHHSLAIDSTAAQHARLTIALSSVTGCVSYRFMSARLENVPGA